MERKGRGIRSSMEKKTLVLVPAAGCWTSVVQVPVTRGGGLQDLIVHAAGKYYPGSIKDSSSLCWTIVSSELKQSQYCLVSVPLGDRIVFNRETVPAIHILSRHVLSLRQKLFGAKDEIHVLVLSEPVHELLTISKEGSRHRLLDDKALDDFLAAQAPLKTSSVKTGLAQGAAKGIAGDDRHAKIADIACLDTRLRGKPLLHPRLQYVTQEQLRTEKVGGLSYGGPAAGKRAILIPALLIAATVLGLLGRLMVERDSIVRDQKKQITRFERELSDYEALISQLDAAKQKVDDLRKQLPVGVYSLLELLSQSFVDGDRLLSVRYEHESRTLTLSSVSSDPIRLLDALSKSGFLSDVRSSGMTPVGESVSRMRVTLSAKVVQ